MFDFFHTFFGCLFILFSVIQTRNPNKLVRDIYEARIFTYQQADFFARFMTWFSCVSFVIMTFLASFR